MRKTFKIITDENTASYKSLDYRTQGRRHGFESGGGTILRAERANPNPPTFWLVGGTKYCLDS